MKPLLIGIAGDSASGKSTFLRGDADFSRTTKKISAMIRVMTK